MDGSSTIGVLVPTNGSAPTHPPEERPIGRAALLLGREGLDVVFGDTVRAGCMTGFRAVSGGWEPVQNIPLFGVHDRFPSQLRAEHYARIQDELNGVPMGNPLSFTMLCRDKLATQRTLEQHGIPMPAVTGDPAEFEECVQQWKSAFIKPQYGALGIGVRHIRPGDPTPPFLPGVVPDRPDPSIVQAAIEPPAGWASRTVRVLLQRTPTGGWFQGTPVVRQSRQNPVANAAQGAEVVSGARALSPECLNEIRSCVSTIASALDQTDEAQQMVEAGVDLVLDSQMKPWLIEVNSRPRGRLEILASTDAHTYRTSHIEACARPIRVIASWKPKD